MIRFNRQFLIVFVLSTCSILIAGESIIKGKVRHANTYNEIPDVNIYIENTGIGTTSDFGGEFLLDISELQGDELIVFKHVAFDSLKMPLSEALISTDFYLLPRIIQARNILVEAEKYNIGIMKDLPQPYSVIEAKRFDVQGYTDAGDLLRTEQNMQVEEELNGKKTVAIRGGNADDVIILYNGIKMNSNFDNVFDLSLINLEDIEHFEIIRGSNTAIYGPEAFSGVINIVPKTYRNYTVRFQQKFGTYASGDWSLLLNHNFFKKLNLSYSYKQGAAKREYADSSLSGEYLRNSLYYHSANAVYDFNGGKKTDTEQNLSIMYFRTSQDYENTRYEESLSNLNQLFTIRYTGHIAVVHDLNLTGSYQWYDISQIIAAQRGFLDRQFKNRSLNFGIEKSKKIDRFQVLAAYQYEYNELDYLDGRYDFDEFQLGLESALLNNRKHGFVSVIKFQSPTGSDFMDRADIDLSYRYDYVKNE
ncbi:MAG: TonB-dependent receptor plug domain-containing protein, partial [Calditrichaceae bacterium]